MLRLTPVAVLLSACAPNNATLTEGEYIAFVADGSSLSLSKGAVVPEDYPETWNLDCRDFEDPDDEAALKLEDPLPICGQNNWPPLHEEWAVQAGFRVVHEPIVPWRGEALITSEGDLQIAFHHKVPGGEDLRFIVAVDPDFSPTTCVQDADGAAVREPLDGDWIENWSQELSWIEDQSDEYRESFAHMEEYFDGGRLFFVNAFSYQLNPADVDQFWSLPSHWQSGSTQGKFVEELFYHRTARYGEPFVYNFVEVNDVAPTITEADLWWCNLEEGSTPADVASDACMIAQDENARAVAATVRDELDKMMSPTGDAADAVYAYTPIVHTNFWRGSDGRPPGFDGWTEMHYNYIVFSKDSLLEEGGSARGAFSYVFDAGDSATRVFVKGKFEIDKIKRDHWVTDNLVESKLLENGVELCEASSEAEAAPSEK